MDAGIVKLESVRDARWDYYELLVFFGQVHFSGQPEGWRIDPEVPESNRGAALDESPIVRVDYMDVDAPDGLWDRSDEIPLNGARPKAPRFPEDFGKRAAVILMRNKRTSFHAVRKRIHIFDLITRRNGKSSAIDAFGS